MNSRTKNFLWVVVVSGAIGAVIGHMIAWNSNGTHVDMFLWPETGKGYLTALYNLALILVSGVLLGTLMDRVGSLLGRDDNKQGTRPKNKQTPGND